MKLAEAVAEHCRKQLFTSSERSADGCNAPTDCHMQRVPDVELRARENASSERERTEKEAECCLGQER